MNTFIFDELTGMPTVLATNRAKRADETGAVSKTDTKVEGKVESKKIQDQKKICFFCKGSENLTPIYVYQDTDDWNVRVIPNKFPIVPDHEVIIHSPEHNKDLTELSHEQNVKYIRALLNRVTYYTAKGMEVMIFNNRGGSAGASLTHPHSQLVALQGFPGIIEHEKKEALQYYNEHNQCYWCDLIVKERELGARVVYETPHYMLIVPKASRWSYEMILLPKRHIPNFEFINEVEINDIARFLRASLHAYDFLFDRPDRNFWFHTQRYDPFHWHIGFIPHLKVFGGLELGAGIWVSDKATPEYAAQSLKEPVKAFYEDVKTSIV